ncbi:hypothetical protein BD410DRAFT_792285, partial [Rickenella mellea]
AHPHRTTRTLLPESKKCTVHHKEHRIERTRDTSSASAFAFEQVRRSPSLSPNVVVIFPRSTR